MLGRNKIGEWFETGDRVTQSQFTKTHQSFINMVDDDMYADGKKNIGIGTDTPDTKLHINGDTSNENDEGILKLSNSLGSGTNLRLGITSAYSWIQSHGAKPLKINPSTFGNDVIINEKAGNVGIGVSNPTSKLHINGDVRINDETLYLRENNNDNGLSYNETFQDGNSNGVNVPVEGIALFGDHGGILGVSESGNKRVALKWDNQGRVGIGLDYTIHNRPTNVLHVHKSNGDSLGHTGLQLTGQSNNSGDILASDGNGIVKWVPKTAITGGLWQDAGNDHITNGNNENVGIGTSLPHSKLHVNGDIRVQDNSIYLRKNTDKNHGLAYYGSNSLISENQKFTTNLVEDINGPVLFGYNGGGLGSTQGTKNLALRWTHGGNVGIGTDSPSQKLHVNGNLALDGDFLVRGTKPFRINRYLFDLMTQNFQLDRTKILPSGARTGGYDTRMLVSEYGGACITGFSAGAETQIRSDNAKINTSNFFQYVSVFQQNGTWHVAADISSLPNSSNKHERWRIDIMFIKKELVEIFNYGGMNSAWGDSLNTMDDD